MQILGEDKRPEERSFVHVTARLILLEIQAIAGKANSVLSINLFFEIIGLQ
jgi:hypothetical protein